MIELQDDFGPESQPPGPPVEPDWVDVDNKLAEAQNQVGNPPDGFRFRRPPESATKDVWITWSDLLRERAGINWEYINQVRAVLPKASAPPVEPPVDPPVNPPVDPPVELGYYSFAVSYQQHSPARDAYPGRTSDLMLWGPHHEYVLRAPGPGLVTRYAFATPLHILEKLDSEYQSNQVALFTDWFCMMTPEDLETYGQNMYVAVYVPDSPISTPYGVMRAGWGGHVRSDVRQGRVDTDDVFAVVWDSGVHFESAGIAARAAHLHACASATGQLTMNGDIDGRAFLHALRWPPTQYLGEIGPGPNEYYTGQWCAGRRLADFQSTGHAIPAPTS